MKDQPAIAFIRTDETPHAVFLCDRFGDWNEALPEQYALLPERFQFEPGTGIPLDKGDPRAQMIDEVCFIAVRNGQLGLLIELELDAVAAGSKHAENAPTDITEYNPEQYTALVESYQEKLSHLQPAWKPEAELFMADGGHIFDGRLAVCAFVPLKGDLETGYFQPFSQGDSRSIYFLVSSLTTLAYGSTEMTTENNRHQLNLSVSVVYDLNGESPKDMETNLRSAFERAMGEGLLTGSTDAEVDEYCISITSGETPAAPKLQDAGQDLASALAGCLEQISQMRGMFDDNDGAIQQAVDAADKALDAWNEAAPKQKTPEVSGPAI